jgi:hypothetical protein
MLGDWTIEVLARASLPPSVWFHAIRGRLRRSATCLARGKQLAFGASGAMWGTRPKDP